jgi:hypothetical protein
VTNPNANRSNTNGTDTGFDRQEPAFYPVPPKSWVRALQMYLRDRPECNILYDCDYEHSVEELEAAWGLALLNWIESPPRISPVRYLDHPARGVLLLLAAYYAIMSVNLKLMRNELAYQDGDQSFSLNHQYKAMTGWAQEMRQSAIQEMKLIKGEENAQQVFGGSNSEFGHYFRELGGDGGSNGSLG